MMGASVRAGGDRAHWEVLSRLQRSVSYCLALDEYCTDAVQRHVGREPSGRSFNESAEVEPPEFPEQ